jgi:hypothetical protein
MITDESRPLHSVESRGVTYLKSMNLRTLLSSLWVGHRPMGTQNPPLGVDECFCEKVIKVKADVAAFPLLFQLRSLSTIVFPIAVHRK